ncbi:MFS transporter [Arthrobacter gyeryongensis]|uniref:MFS transporter n=1 Tax=Arthrobacter gyeryongensis TaxID=1650592 RepID=A0ABP9S8P7_9MICC
MFDPTFGVVFWVKLVMQTAVWAFIMISAILAFKLTESATWVGIVGAAVMLPQLGLALLSGRLSDQYGPVRQLVTGSFISGAASLALSLWFLFSDVGPDVGATALVVSSLIFGVGLALSSPAQQSIIPLLVSAEELPAAVGLNFVPMTLARTAGPALGAFAVNAWGPVPALLFAGSITLLVIPFFRLIQRRLVQGFTAAGDHRILSALKFVWTHKPVLVCLIGVAVIGAGSEAAVTLSPVVANSFGEPSSGGGVLTAAFGLGGLIGVVIHRMVERRGTAGLQGCLAMIILGAAVVVAPLGGTLSFAAGVLVLGGAGMVAGFTAFSIAVQLGSPPEMLGRVMALWTLAAAGFRPPAAVVLGLVADHFSTETALIGAGLFMVAAGIGICVALRYSRTKSEIPSR